MNSQNDIKRYSHKSIYPKVEDGHDFFCRAIKEGNACVPRGVRYTEISF